MVRSWREIATATGLQLHLACQMHEFRILRLACGHENSKNTDKRYQQLKQTELPANYSERTRATASRQCQYVSMTINFAERPKHELPSHPQGSRALYAYRA